MVGKDLIAESRVTFPEILPGERPVISAENEQMSLSERDGWTGRSRGRVRQVGDSLG